MKAHFRRMKVKAYTLSPWQVPLLIPGSDLSQLKALGRLGAEHRVPWDVNILLFQHYRHPAEIILPFS
jgi:hypothetical protein